jgi:hypothetical protein
VSSYNANELTVFYTVGGDSHHYDNLHKSLKSLDRLNARPNVLVLEFGDKLKSSSDFDVVNLPDVIDFSSGKKVGYILWRHKYVAALKVQTKYGVYLDTDVVLASNELEHVIDQLDGGIAVARHFWVPTIGAFSSRAVSPESRSTFEDAVLKMGLSEDDPFFAGGIFAFENNDSARRVFDNTLRYNDDFYRGRGEYVQSMTDELFFAAALKDSPGIVREQGGGFNHCSMGDEHMPLEMIDGRLWGRNPFEILWSPVVALHCDTLRRDPSEKYAGDLRSAVRSAFYL